MLALALAGGCQAGDPEAPPADAYRHAGDRLVVSLGLDGIFPPCIEQHEGYYATDPVPDCFRMTPPRRMKGLWRDEFEGQGFFPGLTRPPVADRGGFNAIWIDIEPSLRPPRTEAEPTGKARWFRIDFIGRQTLYPGQYGHFGFSRHYVIVDRILSLRPVASEEGPAP